MCNTVVLLYLLILVSYLKKSLLGNFSRYFSFTDRYVNYMQRYFRITERKENCFTLKTIGGNDTSECCTLDSGVLFYPSCPASG